MRYSLAQIKTFRRTLPEAIPAPSVMVNNGHATLRKVSDEEYLAIWSDEDGIVQRAGQLDSHGYTKLLERLIDHLPEDHGYALAIADCADHVFDADGLPYLPESGSDYDFAD